MGCQLGPSAGLSASSLKTYLAANHYMLILHDRSHTQLKLKLVLSGIQRVVEFTDYTMDSPSIKRFMDTKGLWLQWNHALGTLLHDFFRVLQAGQTYSYINMIRPSRSHLYVRCRSGLPWQPFSHLPSSYMLQSRPIREGTHVYIVQPIMPSAKYPHYYHIWHWEPQAQAWCRPSLDLPTVSHYWKYT